MNNTWKTSLQYYLIFYFIFDIEGFLFNKLTRLNIKKNQHKRVKQMFDSNSSRLDVLQQVFLHTNTKVFHCHQLVPVTLPETMLSLSRGTDH